MVFAESGQIVLFLGMFYDAMFKAVGSGGIWFGFVWGLNPWFLLGHLDPILVNPSSPTLTPYETTEIPSAGGVSPAGAQSQEKLGVRRAPRNRGIWAALQAWLGALQMLVMFLLFLFFWRRFCSCLEGGLQNEHFFATSQKSGKLFLFFAGQPTQEVRDMVDLGPVGTLKRIDTPRNGTSAQWAAHWPPEVAELPSRCRYQAIDCSYCAWLRPFPATVPKAWCS